jgi:hypothetical protein
MKKSHRLGGLSYLRGELDEKKISTFLKTLSTQSDLFGEEQMDGSLYDVLVIEGDLVVSGNLILEQEKLCGLIVLGNLIVAGHYEDSMDPVTGVYVKGSLSAKSAITAGELVVRENLNIEESLIGDYNDYGATIFGHAKAKLFVTEQHRFNFKGQATFQTVLETGEQCEWKGKKPWVPLKIGSYAKTLVKGVLLHTDDETISSIEEADELVDHDALKQMVRKGKSVLRAK